ncbi:MAG: hypothetical protein IJS60_07115 [Abditibacteriota bacterium]|nr:hypothetical protein [Abditibacteriota bacterium]
MQFLIGLFVVALGSLISGTSPWPYKICKVYKMEQLMFISQLVGMFIVPWIIMFFICDVREAYDQIGFINLVICNLFSLVFGVANIIAINCLYKVGFVMFSVLEGGTAVIISTLIPLIFKGSGVFKNAPDITSYSGLLSIIAVLIMVISIILMSVAGSMRDKDMGKVEAKDHVPIAQKRFWRFMCIVAGVMCTGLLLLNTYYGSLLKDAAVSAGCYENFSSLSIWTFGMFGCIFINVLYSIVLMIKNNTYKIFSNMKEFYSGAISGVQYIFYLFLVGLGTPMMGALGASIGNGVSLSGSAIGKQIIGFLCGEWKGVKGRPVKLLVLSIVFLFVSIILLSLSSYVNK